MSTQYNTYVLSIGQIYTPRIDWSIHKVNINLRNATAFRKCYSVINKSGELVIATFILLAVDRNGRISQRLAWLFIPSDMVTSHQDGPSTGQTGWL